MQLTLIKVAKQPSPCSSSIYNIKRISLEQLEGEGEGERERERERERTTTDSYTAVSASLH